MKKLFMLLILCILVCGGCSTTKHVDTLPFFRGHQPLPGTHQAKRAQAKINRQYHKKVYRYEHKN